MSLLIADTYGRGKRLRRQAKRHPMSEAEYIRVAPRKHLKEVQAHLKRINGAGLLQNGAALLSLDNHVKQYTIGCR